MRKIIYDEGGCPIKIAECEELIFCPMYETDQLEVINYIKKISNLQSQLAEKIEELKLDNKKYFTDNCRANKELADKLKQQNQDKISFCIEQLEKVREFVIENCGLEPAEGKARIEISKYIKQQINELKGENK